MKKGSTHFLRATVIIMALAVIAICAFGIIPMLADQSAAAFHPIIIGALLSAIPFFTALYETMKLLGFIDKNTAFSESSVLALKRIRYCGIAIAVIYVPLQPLLYQIAHASDDTPAFGLFGMVIIGASLVIAVFAAVLQKLLQNAIDMKKENDLVV